MSKSKARFLAELLNSAGAVNVDAGTIDGAVIGGTTAAAGSFTNITVSGTVDGRDVATDGTKLDGIEAGATADQTAAEIRALVEAATDSNVFTDADHTKLNGIEALADVTDTTNVTAAGALMDSELTNITAVKALNQGVATTDSPSFAGLTATTGIDVTGTVTADGLTLDGNDSYTSNIKFDYGASAPTYFANWGYKSSSDGNKVFLTITDGGPAKDVLVANYNGNVGIGTDTPSNRLHIEGPASSHTALQIETTTSGFDPTIHFVSPHNSAGMYLDGTVDNKIKFYNGYGKGAAGREITFDNSGNVGIGTSSPVEKLDISQSVNNSVITKVTNTNSGDLASARVEVHNNDSSFGQLTTYSSGFGYLVFGSSAANWTFIGSSGANSNGLKIGTLTADPIVFGTNDTERMRIDASGSLLLGKTAADSIGTDGIELDGTNDRVLITRNNNEPLLLNRRTSDGDIVVFRKDGATVGSIGAKDGDLTIGTGDTGLYFSDGADAVYPYNPSTQADRDAAVDLGYPTVRFKDLYLSGAVSSGAATFSGNILLNGSGNPTVINKTSGAGNNPLYRLQADTNYWDMLGVFSDADDTFRIRYNGTDAIKIANNGDISFYEDTGTTAKFFWDASAESLGIGTSSVGAKLHLKDTTGSAVKLLELETAWNSPSGNKSIEWTDATNTLGRISVDYTSPKASMRFGSLYNSGYQTGDVMTLTADGNVGIGVVPIAHHYKSLEIGNAGSQITGRTAADTYFMSGLYWSSNSTIKYAVSSVPVGYYNITNGAHFWNNSAAGTAGNDATINTAMTLDASGNVGIGTSSPSSFYAGARQLVVGSGSGEQGITVYGGNTSTSYLLFADGASGADLYAGQVNYNHADNSLNFNTNGITTPRMKLDASGNLLVGKTALSVPTVGVELRAAGPYVFTAATDVVLINRMTTDGILINFRQDDVTEGTISVSGTTVSYNGGHLSRWAQTTTVKDEFLVKGTVLSNLDEMNVYTNAEGKPVDNEQLNKVKVSDVEGDVNVAGVFVNWTHDEEHNVDEINMAMTGDMIIRIAQGTTVARGDLLMSAGDGTAKPQGDDIVRSKTIAKVTSTHVTCKYADGSYCVPCVLMAC